MWRAWLAFAWFLPLLCTFGIGLPTACVTILLWSQGGWPLVASVWAQSDKADPPFWAAIGLILALSVGCGVAALVWHTLFFWSGFLDEHIFERYLDLTKSTRLVQAMVVLAAVGGALIWLMLRLFPA